MGFFQNIRGPELLIILLIIVLLFGAKKLPDTARGLGRSLRIFKAETKGLTDDENEAAPAAQQQPAPQQAPQQVAPQQSPQQIAAPPAQPPTASADQASWPAPSSADERS
ncbi:MAG: Sec-independent protein translocase subunit TatA [Jiangellales bacterium]